MMVRVPSRATSTNPVRNVPASPPKVPAAESPPNTEPVSSRLERRSLATIGVLALSTAAGRKNATVASTTICRGSLPRLGPIARTIGTATQTSAPPTKRDGPSSRRGSWRSARCPPTPAPVAMPARITPMMAVKVSSETPT